MMKEYGKMPFLLLSNKNKLNAITIEVFGFYSQLQLFKIRQRKYASTRKQLIKHPREWKLMGRVNGSGNQGEGASQASGSAGQEAGNTGQTLGS